MSTQVPKPTPPAPTSRCETNRVLLKFKSFASITICDGFVNREAFRSTNIGTGGLGPGTCRSLLFQTKQSRNLHRHVSCSKANGYASRLTMEQEKPERLKCTRRIYCTKMEWRHSKSRGWQYLNTCSICNSECWPKPMCAESTYIARKVAPRKQKSG